MKINLYAIIDTCSGVYDGPAPGKTDASVTRSFIDMVANAEHPVGKHPEHYTLVKVGQWNDSTGELKDYQNLTLITGLEALAQLRNPGKDLSDEEIANFGGTN